MNGLQAIRERILDEARQAAAQIDEQAEKQVGEILSVAEQEKIKIVTEAEVKAEKQAEALLARARSTALMESRKKLLQARRQMIEQAISGAVERIRALPERQRIAYYRDLIASSSIKDGEIILSAADRHLADQLLEGRDGLRLSDETGRFNGGLILRQGQVEDNLTLAIIVAGRRPELVRMAADVLFPDDNAG
ncbi:MAG: V-type ATP synthase subunit E [Saccharofermentanales bacterium]|nr:hypothetical protein [Clostridiaceae bacterium]